jgi:hypothetical protein
MKKKNAKNKQNMIKICRIGEKYAEYEKNMQNNMQNMTKICWNMLSMKLVYCDILYILYILQYV